VTAYSRADFGTNPLAGADRNNAKARGWGSGWPNCQSSKMVKVTNGDHAVVVRREVAELVATLLKITAALGYDVNPKGQVNQTWGFACRAIRGSSTASNHSWGLAVDLNSLANPMGSTFHTNIPPAVIHAWEVCRWFWGGRYQNRPDTMHLEYVGTPAQVAGDLARAKSILANLLNPKPPAGNQPEQPGKDVEIHAWSIRNAAGLEDTPNPVMNPTDEAYGDASQFLAWASHPKIAAITDRSEQGWHDAMIRDKRYPYAAKIMLEAVKAVQRKFGLVPDGVFGPKTGAVMARSGYKIVN
jgi:hypothetical protein